MSSDVAELLVIPSAGTGRFIHSAGLYDRNTASHNRDAEPSSHDMNMAHLSLCNTSLRPSLTHGLSMSRCMQDKTPIKNIIIRMIDRRESTRMRHDEAITFR